jgi:o-succinylbenzoate synthase
VKIERAQLFSVRLPLKRRMSNAQTNVAFRDSTLLCLSAEGGLCGWGEASLFPGFGNETPDGSRAALARVAEGLLGREVADGSKLVVDICAATTMSPSANAAAETAVLDLAARAQEVPLCDLLVPKAHSLVDHVVCNALLAGDDLADLEASVARELAAGFRVLKLKVGVQSVAEDVARVARVRRIAGDDVTLRLDTNQAYTIGGALAALEAFAPYAIEYIEQPLAADELEAMAELRNKSPIRIAADESALGEADALKVIGASAADIIVIKPSAAGGPTAAVRIARSARRAGIEVVVTSLLDSAIGVAAAFHAATAIASEGPVHACGLASGTLLASDVATGIPMLGGRLRMPAGVGLGVQPDESLVRDLLDRPAIEWRV